MGGPVWRHCRFFLFLCHLLGSGLPQLGGFGCGLFSFPFQCGLHCNKLLVGAFQGRFIFRLELFELVPQRNRMDHESMVVSQSAKTLLAFSVLHKLYPFSGLLNFLVGKESEIKLVTWLSICAKGTLGISDREVLEG